MKLGAIIAAICLSAPVIGAPSAPRISVRQTGSTENGVTDNAGCTKLTLIFARGTGEAGNMGKDVGPPLANALISLLGSVTVQGVNYDACDACNLELGANGGPAMADLVKQALSQCPDSKVVLGGYSQGAMVLHNAVTHLQNGQVSAAVLFGDPEKFLDVENVDDSKTKEYCHQGDPVCENGLNVADHLNYAIDAGDAANFLVQAAGV